MREDYNLTLKYQEYTFSGKDYSTIKLLQNINNFSNPEIMELCIGRYTSDLR
jgi:hypothetical protein